MHASKEFFSSFFHFFWWQIFLMSSNCPCMTKWVNNHTVLSPQKASIIGIVGAAPASTACLYGYLHLQHRDKTKWISTNGSRWFGPIEGTHHVTLQMNHQSDLRALFSSGEDTDEFHFTKGLFVEFNCLLVLLTTKWVDGQSIWNWFYHNEDSFFVIIEFSNLGKLDYFSLTLTKTLLLFLGLGISCPFYNFGKQMSICKLK